MKYCAHCGHQLQDQAKFCERCGTPTVSESAQFKEEKDFLDMTHRFLKYERIAWRVLGIFALVFGILYFVFGLLILAGAAGLVLSEVPQSAFALGAITFFLCFASILLIGIAVVSLVTAKKIEPHLTGLYLDIHPAVERCSSIPLMILAIFFNKIALIFFLINFFRIRSNRALIERIAAHQNTTK